MEQKSRNRTFYPICVVVKTQGGEGDTSDEVNTNGEAAESKVIMKWHAPCKNDCKCRDNKTRNMLKSSTVTHLSFHLLWFTILKWILSHKHGCQEVHLGPMKKIINTPPPTFFCHITDIAVIALGLSTRALGTVSPVLSSLHKSWL